MEEKDEYPSTQYTPLARRQRFARSKIGNFYHRHKLVVIDAIMLLLLLPLLGLLALRNRHSVRAAWVSPTVYPSRKLIEASGISDTRDWHDTALGYGSGNWSDAYKKAHDMVSQMTFEEMNNITVGFVNGDNGCVGKSGSVPRLEFPGFCLHDAGNGVRATDGVNAYASGVSIGASWNATLAYERGQFMGQEFKKKGVQVALGPVVGPIGRIATGGMWFVAVRLGDDS
jgi:beta-glucosidase